MFFEISLMFFCNQSDVTSPRWSLAAVMVSRATDDLWQSETPHSGEVLATRKGNHHGNHRKAIRVRMPADSQRCSTGGCMSRQDTPRSDDHRTLVAIREYVDLYRLGRKVALDVNRKTGEVVCMYTRPMGGAKGEGSVPMP
jgi:hypothetical protein